MKKQILLILLSLTFLLFILTNCSSNEEIEIKNYQNTEVSKDSIDGFLERKMKELIIPGLSFAIINSGQVVHHKTLGYSNIENKEPVTAKTIFEGASMSKSVFAFFVMKYVEDGQLDLDKPLFKYLPYEDLENDERYKKITARMVLSHRSGLPNWRENEEGKKLKIKFDPGTDFEYSGEGYQYLTLVLKEIEGADWNDLEKAFQNKIAKPLGLENTVFIQNDYIKNNKAEPYDKNGKRIDWKNNYWYNKDKNTFVAASSIHSEALDFSKWMITVMKKKFLSENSYNEILRPHSKLNTSESGTTYFYSLGFITGDNNYKNTYFHSGSNDGFTCWYLFNIEKDWGFVVFTNSEYGEELGNELFEYLGGT